MARDGDEFYEKIGCPYLIEKYRKIDEDKNENSKGKLKEGVCLYSYQDKIKITTTERIVADYLDKIDWKSSHIYAEDIEGKENQKV